MMLVYWIQSVIIGGSNVIRIASLERFDPCNFKMGGRPVQETASDKRKVALFFLVHYGFFHLIYLLFVTVDSRGERRDAAGRPSIGAVMFMPYLRVLPMHFTILFGGLLFSGTLAFVLFGALKTAADAVMHTIEHHVLGGNDV
jgi:hypothetical protein